VLQLAEFLFEPDQGSSRARVAWWLAHPARIQLAQTAGLLAVACMIGTFWFAYRLLRDQSPRLSAVAISMILCAMVGLAAVHGIEMAAHWAAVGGHRDAAVTILNAKDPGIPGVVGFVMFLPMAFAGNILAAVAMWRSRYVPRITVAVVVAFTLLDFVADMGVLSHAVDLLTGLLLAWAVLTRYVRSPRTPLPAAAD
jgi:hypothetical protein